MHARHAVLATTKTRQDKARVMPHAVQVRILQQARLNAHHVTQESIQRQQPLHARPAVLDTTKGLQDKLLAYNVR